jgi:hypothetical protein
MEGLVAEASLADQSGDTPRHLDSAIITPTSPTKFFVVYDVRMLFFNAQLNK